MQSSQGFRQRVWAAGGWQLAAYLVALAVAWSISAGTWTIIGGRLELGPLGQALQYLLVVLAATLAGNRLIIASRGQEAEDAVFGFYERRWAVRRDRNGMAWWTCIWAGIAAMVLNIVILGATQLLFGSLPLGSVLGEYLGLIGLGIAAGAVIGSFSALIAVLITR